MNAPKTKFKEYDNHLIAKTKSGHKFIIDKEDERLLWECSWHVCGNEEKRKYVKFEKYSHGKPESVLLHRVIARAKKGQMVDHINGDTMDNRRSNLRICSNSQNQINRSKAPKTKTGFTGVTVAKSGKAYEASITVSGKRIYLGYFKSIQKAIEARKEAERHYFGDFSTT